MEGKCKYNQPLLKKNVNNQETLYEQQDHAIFAYMWRGKEGGGVYEYYIFIEHRWRASVLITDGYCPVALTGSGK